MLHSSSVLKSTIKIIFFFFFFFQNISDQFPDSIDDNIKIEYCENIPDSDFLCPSSDSNLSETSTSSSAPLSKSKQIKQSNRKRKIPSTELQQETATLNRYLEVNTPNDPKDEYDVFGAFVAQELRQYKNDEILKIETKNAIQTCLITASSKFIANKYNS